MVPKCVGEIKRTLKSYNRLLKIVCQRAISISPEKVGVTFPDNWG